MNTYIFVISSLFKSKYAVLKFFLYIFLYLFLSAVIIDFRIFSSFYATSLPLLEKISTSPYLFFNSLLSMTPAMQVLHFSISVLFALNLLTVTQKVKSLKNPSIKIGMGAGIISLTTAGCASCGLSLLAIFGLGSAITLLPWHGAEILITTLIILMITFIYNLKILTKSCNIK